jgi:uncharacterized protein
LGEPAGEGFLTRKEYSFAEQIRSPVPLQKDQMSMDSRLARLLRRHHVLTLSTTSVNGSWIAHCFYAFLPDDMVLVFTTDPNTRHGREMLQNPNVSGGIMLETKMVGKIRGIQLTGQAFICQSSESAGAMDPSLPECRQAYLKRFPYAIAMKPDFWFLHINYVKLTDNRLGFGTKLEWEREVSG